MTTEQGAGLLAGLAAALAGGTLRVIDLTQPLSEDSPILPLPPQWPNTLPFKLAEISRNDARGPFWYWNNFTTGEHTGTHFDAPVHWASGTALPNNTTDTIPAGRFVGPACVMDVSAAVAKNPDYVLTPDDIVAWERQHGRIGGGAWFLLRTDWSKRTGDAFLNNSADGPHSPGFTKEASLLLATERDIVGVGVETVGTDAGQAGTFDPPFPNHTIMHGNGKFGLASLCNLDQLPATGAIVIAAPLKIVGGSGSPVRVIALAP